MSPRRRNFFPLEFARRCVAVGGIGLVLLLTTLTASPNLHRLFHGDADAGSDDGCAVVQFAQGISTVADTAVLASTPVDWHRAFPVSVAQFFLASPRYLHQPERGPPVG